MRQRNQFLALVLLALFAASGVWYFHVYVQPKKAFGIILFVGEGLVTSKLTAARLYDGGAGHRLAMDSLPHVALLRTSAADSAVPDAAAAASALSCGVKVNHRALCVDPSGRQLPTLLGLAADHHRATGLITTGRLTDPVPAAFYAHTPDCRNRDDLAPQLLADPRLQVILGGGAADFLPKKESLVNSAVAAKYKLLRTPADLQATFGNGPARLLGLFTPGAMPYHDQLQAGGVSRPGLSEMVAAAIDTLQRQRNGYVLVVDAGLVERASLENRAERGLQELVELDRAVAVALQYAGSQSLVIVAGGESIGGMALNGDPPRSEQGESLLGRTHANGLPAVTWATGPAGPAPDASPSLAPAACYLPEAANVADDAVAAASGPGAEGLQGFKENTFVFDLIHSQL